MSLQKECHLFAAMLDDIKKTIQIDPAFQNCEFSGSIKEGEPFYMAVSARTTNIDFPYWKEKLGPYRKIEDQVNADKSVALHITKKHKYQ